ncbi:MULTISPECIES: TonB-dependent hemoglobin/transferrin/lactoferrin family receptor [unclassified Aureimonas]|uniref:TonB-dependent hemoglobin/transferrin/lactoferrin family receptor n=1 Tax=unclassified Aureimonas TaxID=2615206 RepID=UPI000700203E|nr:MULTISPECIES: TonB-dependent hemoglobin/transferrin/lactoferrin family receptor [unclassified Aureimonas]KQT53823.1 hypothetical protein ASG62_11280 [Aureimonas sp. Leaf427]KQT71736.1 hypothetical protein ASG54_19880 [Aureimonas sp. Leaf460]
MDCMRRRTTTALATSLALLAAASQGALAQTTASATGTSNEAIVLDTVTLDGAKKAEPAGRAETVLTKRVTRAELDAAQVDDFDDVSRLDPAINFSEGSRSFNIRGLDRSRVLTTIDGVRVPWLEDGARGLVGGSASFDFDTLSGLDIVKGANSSVFGGGALGGVVALRTLDPEDLLPGDKRFGGLSRAGYDSKDRSWSVDQALAARFGDTYSLVQAGFRRGNEIENQGVIGGFGAPRTDKDPLDYDRTSLLAKINQHVEGGHVFGLTAESFDRDEDTNEFTALTTTYVPGSVTRDETNKRQRLSFEYDYAPEETNDRIRAAHAVVYWQNQEIDNDFNAIRRTRPIGDYRRLTERGEETFGLSGSALAGFQTGAIDHGVSFGGEAFMSQATQASSGRDSCPPPPYPPAFFNCNFLHSNQSDMPDVDGTTLGLFVEDEMAFLENRFRLTPGVRFDWYEQEPQATEGYTRNPTYRGLPASSSDSALSPKLRAEYDLAPEITVFGQWAQAFRAPTANELYLTYGGPGTYLRIGDPDLKPETSDGFEAGVKFGTPELNGSVNAFYNTYENFIDDVAVTPASVGLSPGVYPLGITQIVNRANVEIYGFEATANVAHPSGWHGFATFGGYVGRDTDTDVHLNTIPAVKARLGVGYATDVYGADVIFTAAAARDEVENDFAATPSYNLVDLTAWWAPTEVKGLKVKGGVYNLFDEIYYDGLDIPDSTSLAKPYFTEPGRSFKATLTYQF